MRRRHELRGPRGRVERTPPRGDARDPLAQPGGNYEDRDDARFDPAGDRTADSSETTGRGRRGTVPSGTLSGRTQRKRRV